MLSTLLRRKSDQAPDLLTSKLFNEDTFYPAFLKDLDKCLSELIIECPFITYRRLNYLLPTLQKLKARKVRVVINTRDPHEHDDERWRAESHQALATWQREGTQVIYTVGHHRKLVIVDRSILYEGSLNVLSQNSSCEVMRRTESVQLAWQMIRYIEIDRYLN